MTAELSLSRRQVFRAAVARLVPRWRPGVVSRPRPVQVGLLAIVAFAGLVSGWNLGYAGLSAYYSTAARSMSMSWRAFVFGSLDPGARITLDKLSGFLLPQALSARLFGFHPWALALPQVLEGMVTVAVVYLIGRRWRGEAVGLLAAAVMATTPLLASMFGHVMEDGLLTMSLTLALAACQQAVLAQRLRWLLMSAGWVAVGFQAKMLQAWVIVPALGVCYLLGARASLARRAWHLLAALALCVGLSLSWMTAIQLVPGADRPYIDGTTNNNVYSMVFGYNGVNRLMAGVIPGAISNHAPALALPGAVAPAHSGPGMVRARRRLPSGRETSKLVLPYYAVEVGWWYPAAVAGLLLEGGLLLLVAGRRRSLRRVQRQTPPVAAGEAEPGGQPALWPASQPQQVVAGERAAVGRVSSRASVAVGCSLGVWGVLAAGLVSVSKVPHVAYFATISVQIALLAAAGLGGALRSHRVGQWRWLLPGLVGAQTAWTAMLLARSGVAPSFLLPAVLSVGLLAAALLLIGGPRLWQRRAWAVSAVLLSVLAVLLAPAVWTGYASDRARDGNADEAYVGPRPVPGGASYRLSRPLPFPPDPRLSVKQLQFAGYLRAHGAGELLMVTDRWASAAPYILYGRFNVLSMGGYSGRAPTPSLRLLQLLVRDGRLRFALLTDPGWLNHNSTVQSDQAWLRGNCQSVSSAQLGLSLDTGRYPEQLYSCDQAPGRTEPIRPASAGQRHS